MRGFDGLRLCSQAVKAAHAQGYDDQVEIPALHPHQRFLEGVGGGDFMLGGRAHW